MLHVCVFVCGCVGVGVWVCGCVGVWMCGCAHVVCIAIYIARYTFIFITFLKCTMCNCTYTGA